MSPICSFSRSPAKIVTYRIGNLLGLYVLITMVTMVTMMIKLLVANWLQVQALETAPAIT